MTKEEFLFQLYEIADYPENWLDKPNVVFNNQYPRDMMETEEGLAKLKEMIEFLKKETF
jgi:uncharacterized protein (DUF2384 family)